MDGCVIEEFAFFVVEPSPFVEVFAHVSYVYAQHFERFVGFFGVVVYYACVWKIDGQIVSMYSSCKVHIFGIHKVSFVKESYFL